MPFTCTHHRSPAHAEDSRPKRNRAGTATYFALTCVRTRLADRYTRVTESGMRAVTGRHPGRMASKLRGAN